MRSANLWSRDHSTELCRSCTSTGGMTECALYARSTIDRDCSEGLPIERFSRMQQRSERKIDETAPSSLTAELPRRAPFLSAGCPVDDGYQTHSITPLR